MTRYKVWKWTPEDSDFNEAGDFLTSLSDNDTVNTTLRFTDFDETINATIEDVIKHYNIPFEDFGVFIFHPITTELETLEDQINQIVSALIDSKKNYIVIYPNNDSGTEIILKRISELNINMSINKLMRLKLFLWL